MVPKRWILGLTMGLVSQCQQQNLLSPNVSIMVHNKQTNQHGDGIFIIMSC
jgi:hypothetical protein